MTQSIWSVDSSPPSRLVRMTSTAVITKTSSLFEMSGPERTGKQRLHGERLGLGVHEARGAAVLVEQLAAPAARGEGSALAVDAGDGDQAPAAGRGELGDHAAL